MSEERYIRQTELLGQEGQAELAGKSVLILGCGGLGGYLIEHMLRIGIGSITAVDGDRFEGNNLNRQLLSTVPLLGKGKAEAASARAAQVNPAVSFTAVDAFFTEENADALVAGKDLVLDGLDNIPSRLLAEDVCARHGIPLVHGAIWGEYVQVAVVPPGSGMLHILYGSVLNRKPSKASISYTPACCAAIQCEEASKLLLGQESALWGKVMHLSLADLKHTIMELV